MKGRGFQDNCHRSAEVHGCRRHQNKNHLFFKQKICVLHLLMTSLLRSAKAQKRNTSKITSGLTYTNCIIKFSPEEVYVQLCWGQFWSQNDKDSRSHLSVYWEDLYSSFSRRGFSAKRPACSENTEYNKLIKWKKKKLSLNEAVNCKLWTCYNLTKIVGLLHQCAHPKNVFCEKKLINKQTIHC